MKIPTREEYEKAKNNVQAIQNWIYLERKSIDELLDKILACRAQIKMYEETIKSQQSVINIYELYHGLTK